SFWAGSVGGATSPGAMARCRANQKPPAPTTARTMRATMRNERRIQLFYPMFAGIQFHASLAQEADQRLPTLTGKINCQARGRRDRRNHGNPRGQRLLHDLERGASAYHEDMLLERQQP